MQQRTKMLPGEKQKRRKEAIARKRLERSQDRDGFIDMGSLAEQIRMFAETAERQVVHNEERGEEDDREETPQENELWASGDGGFASGEGSNEEMRGGGSESGGRRHEAAQEEPDDAWMAGNAGVDGAARMVLPPLSGPHLDAAKKLARYFRVDSRELGSGKKRALELRPAKGKRPPPDLDAVALLLEKLHFVESSTATTKRLPKFTDLPGPGTQAQFGAWERHTSGFGGRMLASMGMDMHEAAGAAASEVFTRQAPHLSTSGLGFRQGGSLSSASAASPRSPVGI